MYTEFDNPFAERPEGGIKDNPVEFTCVKTVTYTLKPFGNFQFKWKKTKLYNERLNWLYLGETSLNHNDAMPLSKEDEDQFVKLMKKHKTDVFIDNEYGFPKFYTRTGSGMTPIEHDRLTRYYNDLKNGVKYEK